MPKVSVYLSDDLYGAARAQGLSISALAQHAIEQALGAAQTGRWVDQVRARPARVTARIDTAAALEGAREEFGA
jgi:post-segregation antitoxin (ccd killing protein)